MQRVRTATWGWLAAFLHSRARGRASTLARRRARFYALTLCAALGLLAGCSDVESCKESETPGCINTAPRDDINNPCLYDLVLRGTKCVKPGSTEDLCGLCAPGALCVPERNTCVNFCEPQSPLPGSGGTPEAIFCEAVSTVPGQNPMLTFEETCTRRCRLQCQRYEQFCPGYQCPPGSCDQPDVQAKCLAECPLAPNGGKDTACIAQSCTNARLQICDSKIMCPNGATPACANVTCTNDCMFQSNDGLSGDGVCDDGDVVSSDSPLCQWGTDCIDCGPRVGARPLPGNWGASCQYLLNCAGGTGHPADANAWCVQQTAPAGTQRCMPDCSRGQGCPDGFDCYQVEQLNEAGARVPIIEGGITAQACFPTMCM